MTTVLQSSIGSSFYERIFRQAGKQFWRGLLLTFIACLGSPYLVGAQQGSPAPLETMGVEVTAPDGWTVHPSIPGENEGNRLYIVTAEVEHNFGTEGNVPPDSVQVEVKFTPPGGRALVNPAAAENTVDLQTFDEEAIEWEMTPDDNDPEDEPSGVVTLIYITGMIVPAAGQSGETGDMVPSIKGPAGQRHFVSPRKPTNLPEGYDEFINTDDHVILRFDGATAQQFEEFLRWELGPKHHVDPEDPLQLKVERDHPFHHTIQIRLKSSGEIVALTNTWIVWVESKRVPVHDTVDLPNRRYIRETEVLAVILNGGATIQTFQWIEGEIKPPGICDISADIPNLIGAPTKETPEHESIHAASGRQMNWVAENRWHFARRVRLRADTKLDGTGAGYLQNAPVYSEFPTDGWQTVRTSEHMGNDGYPTVPLLGNDTSLPSNVYHPDPYSDPPRRARISDYDAPIMAAANVGGELGDSAIFHLEYQTFPRLQIGDKWHLVGPYYEWQMRAVFRKVPSENDGHWVPITDGEERSFAGDGNDNWNP